MKLSIRLAVLLACILLACEAGKAQQADWRMKFVPIDPWRAIDGQTNFVKLDGVEFCGQIVEVMPHAVRIEGEFGPLGMVYYPVNGWVNLAVPPQYADYFVTNYPYPAIQGGIIASAARLMAWHTGTYTYKTVKGETRTIAKLDYGVPCGPNPALLAAHEKQLQQVDEKKRETEMRRVKFLEKDAMTGDSSAQYSLGFHYLHGIGCDTNEAMAIFWMTKSAKQGNMIASNDLQEIVGISISPSTNSASDHQ